MSRDNLGSISCVWYLVCIIYICCVVVTVIPMQTCISVSLPVAHSPRAVVSMFMLADNNDFRQEM